jgi:peptidoglycan/xylan/chitin deacetylase (PgdA/CDA1 family)
MSQYAQAWYQWNYRPQDTGRPAWFKSWPGGAKIAVTLKMMHEWQSLPRGGARSGMPHGSQTPYDYLSLCQREYGFKEGVWRLMDVLDKHNVKATAMVSGLAAELWPDSIRALKDRGHEIATHQWDQGVQPPTYKSADEERMFLRQSMEALKRVTGERPYGYFSQGPRCSPNTLDVIAGEDFVWTGDYQDSDVPYVIEVGGKKIVSVGFVRPAYTDNDLTPLGLAGGLRQLTDAFDATYEEAQRHPMKFAYGAHTHISGGPGMAKLLDQFLTHVRKQKDVWFCTSMEMARFWLEHHNK